MKLSVVIVNYNVKYYLEQCLTSLLRAIESIEAEVIVVDNASTDESYLYLSERFSAVRFICNTQNTGFAFANNLAIKQSEGDYILLLNPDTVVGEEAIINCLNFMDRHPNAGAAGAKMVTGDGSFLPESKRGFPSPLTSLYKFTGLCRVFPMSTYFGKYHLKYLREDSVHKVDVLCGAFMMLRRNILEKIDLLDESFFMYGEDIDISYRIVQAGFDNYYLPYPILHYKGESSKENTFKYIKVFYEAMIIFFRKHYSHTGILFSLLVKAAVYFRAAIALCWLLLKPKLTDLLPHSRRKISFLVFGSEKTIRDIRILCKKYKFDGEHKYIVANENSTSCGHLNLGLNLRKYSHIIYDCDTYSFAAIIKLISANPIKNVSLGIYSHKTNVLVTPQNIYIV